MGHTDPPDDEFSFQFSPDSNSSPAVDIVQAVAWVKGLGEDELAPIAESIDPDALSDLFRRGLDVEDFYRGPGDNAEEFPRVEFTYEGCVVTIQGPDKFIVKTVE